MSRFPFALLILIALAACDDMREGTANALDTAGNETNASIAEMRNILGVGHKPPPKLGPADERYCYKTIQDIICYSRPIAGQNRRLVAYQEASGKTGYVLGEDDSGRPLTPLETVVVKTPPAVVVVPARKPPATKRHKHYKHHKKTAPPAKSVIIVETAPSALPPAKSAVIVETAPAAAPPAASAVIVKTPEALPPETVVTVPPPPSAPGTIHEVIFDPVALQPKDLVPEKQP